MTIWSKQRVTIWLNREAECFMTGWPRDDRRISELQGLPSNI